MDIWIALEVERWLDSEYLVKEEPTVFADGLDTLCVRNKPRMTPFYEGPFSY